MRSTYNTFFAGCKTLIDANTRETFASSIRHARHNTTDAYRSRQPNVNERRAAPRKVLPRPRQPLSARSKPEGSIKYWVTTRVLRNCAALDQHQQYSTSLHAPTCTWRTHGPYASLGYGLGKTVIQSSFAVADS